MKLLTGVVTILALGCVPAFAFDIPTNGDQEQVQSVFDAVDRALGKAADGEKTRADVTGSAPAADKRAAKGLAKEGRGLGSSAGNSAGKSSEKGTGSNVTAALQPEEIFSAPRKP